MKNKKIHPYLMIIITFVSVILAGMVALVMPFASTSGKSMGFVDSLFMSTSAVCVTGLSVKNIAVELSLYGKIVMAFLMEIGGLSFITIAVFFFTIIGAKIGLSNRYLLRESLNQNSASGVVALVKKIIITALIIQGIGVVVNAFPLVDYYDDFWAGLGASFFHTIAAFNNAGFDVFGDSSMIVFKDDVLLNISTMMLIVLGGVGFVVLNDVISSKRWRRLKFHTKLTLVTTFVLIVVGALLFKLVVKDMSWLQAIFTSITSRTAGFATYDMAKLSEYPAAYMLTIMLMMVGASPCSTGGGIKTTTFAVLILSIVYYARGKKARAFKRSISDQQTFKAFVLIALAFGIVFVTTFIVGAIQPELTLEKIFFEVTSAFSTTGLSMGITASLNSANRIILCFVMFFGRLGPLTIIGVLNKNWMSASKEEIQYVEESVIVG